MLDDSWIPLQPNLSLMDPRNAKNFVPPSETSERARFMSASKIPDNGPIQLLMTDGVETALESCPDQGAEDGRELAGVTQSVPPPHSVHTTPGPSTSATPLMARSRAGSRANSDDSQDLLSGIPEGIPPPAGRARDFVVPEIHEPAYLNSANLEEVPGDVPRQARTLEDYSFPSHRLATQMRDPTKAPLVLVACGSFSPITYLHLRMFEMALDAVGDQTRFEVIGGYYSPVSDHYRKAGLAPAHHRVRMCELACERTSSWLMVDAWESLQPEYQRTATVLDHFNYHINVRRRGIANPYVRGGRCGVKIMLLAGGDLIESMGEPNVWMDADLRHILGRYGCMIVERAGSDVRSFLLSHDIMYEHRHNVLVIKQLIYNDISSTKVRLFIRRNMSVQYLTPSSVIRYIYEKKLYLESEPVKSVMSERGD